MTERVLDEAMRYGSRRAYETRDLGKFGLGLKTASLSQCRRLTVASRTTPSGRIRIRRWDLDHVRQATPGSSSGSCPSECPPYLLDPLEHRRNGRPLGEARPHSRVRATRRRARGAGARGDERLRSPSTSRWCSTGSSPARPRKDGGSKIVFNGEPLEAMGSVRTPEPATQKLPEQRLFVEHGESTYVRASSSVRAPEPGAVHRASRRIAAAAGPKKWNRQQGFYIYRGDRLIQSGGWNRLRTMDEHSKLARIAIDVPPELEELFQINVAKMRVVMPEEARPQLRALAAGVVNARAGGISAATPARRSVGCKCDESAFVAEARAWSLGDVWPVVAEMRDSRVARTPRSSRPRA